MISIFQNDREKRTYYRHSEQGVAQQTRDAMMMQGCTERLPGCNDAVTRALVKQVWNSGSILNFFHQVKTFPLQTALFEPSVTRAKQKRWFYLLLTTSTKTVCGAAFIFVFVFWETLFFPDGTCHQSADIFCLKECQIFSCSPQAALNTSWKISQAVWVAESGQRQAAKLCLTWCIGPAPDLNHIKLSQKLLGFVSGGSGKYCARDGGLVVGKFQYAFYFGVDVKISLHLCLLWLLRRTRKWYWNTAKQVLPLQF